MESIGLRGYAACLGEIFQPSSTEPDGTSTASARASARLESDVAKASDLAKDFGELSRTATSDQRSGGLYLTGDLHALRLRAGWESLTNAGVAPKDVDLLIHFSALPESQMVRPGSSALLDRFTYISSWLKEQLGLTKARVAGVQQQGCSAFFGALDFAAAKLQSDRTIENVLCIGGDAFPRGHERTVFHNRISDAGAACLLSRRNLKLRLLGLEQITKAYFWDTAKTENELLSCYFPTAQRVVEKLFSRLGVHPDSVDAVLPSGIRRDTWPILTRLWGIPVERCVQIEFEFGHTIQADSLLVLQAAADRLKPGMRVLLFGFGFGATWSAALGEIE